MHKSKVGNINKKDFNRKPYNSLNKIMILIYTLLILVYIFRDKLYKFDNKYITLFTWVAPNLISSFIFTLIGIFYMIPIYFRDIKTINNSKLLWLINILNILVFAIIEYLHVVFKLGIWDNKDMVASLIGIILATMVYFKFRGEISVEKDIKMKTIDEYIGTCSEEIQPKLMELRQIIRDVSPELIEKISWGMPTFYFKGNIIHFAAHKKHIGLYCGAEAVKIFSNILHSYKTSNGTIQIPNDRELDIDLIQKIVRFNIEGNRNK
jgi:uncharacterized protein YdhG (YjbR/CyaY superfamily)